jgi:hypothetical protein
MSSTSSRSCSTARREQARRFLKRIDHPEEKSDE